MTRLICFLESIVEILGQTAKVCILLLVMLVGTNVILRYFFSFSPVSLQELEWHLISPIALLGLAYAMKHKADVRVDFLYERFSPAVKLSVDIFSSLLTICVGGILCWIALPYVAQSFNIAETSADPGGLTHRYLLKAFIPLGFALITIQGVAEVLKSYLVWKETISNSYKSFAVKESAI